MTAPTEKDLPHAIVIGLDTMQGLQTARILAAHRVPVIAFARNADHHACRTRVCQEIRYCDTCSEELIRSLIALGPGLPAKAVIYPCHDQSVSLISRHRDSLQKWYHVILAAPEVVEMLMDKVSLYDFAGKYGFRIPRTWLLHERRDAEAAAAALRFPCVLKPSRRSALWDAQTTHKAYKVCSRGKFLPLYDQVCGWAPTLIAQEWIEGADADLYSCNCYFGLGRELVASFVARKLRQWPPRAGSSCLGEEIRNDVVRDEAIRIFGLTGYRGLGYVEMKRDTRDGEHYLIEANVGRPTGRSAIAEAGGVQMLYAMYCDAVGRPRPANLQQTYRGVKWIDLRHDIQSALYYWWHQELTLVQWWNSWRGPKAHAVFSWTDPMPFLWDLWRAARMATSRGKRARRRRGFPVGGAQPKSRNVSISVEQSP